MWTLMEGMSAIGQPAVAAFRDFPVDRNVYAAFEWRRVHVFATGSADELNHSAYVAFRNNIAPERWCIKISGNPAAAGVLEQQGNPEILDIVVVGDDGAVRHLRLQPPPDD